MASNSRALAFLSLAVVSAFVAFLLTREFIQRDPELPSVSAAPVTEMAPVVVVTQDLPAGATILASQLTVVDWPKGFLPSGHFRDPAQVDRRVLSRGLLKDEPLLESALAPAGTAAGLSALISESHRAITVRVDAMVGVAGFIQPRSRVDILATMRLDDQGRGRQYTSVILQDIKVLAIDQQRDDTRAGEPQLVSVVTLEVTPRDAQKLAYAITQGSLQLILRNPADDEVQRLQGVTARDVVPVFERPRVARPTPAPSPKIETIRGSRVRQESY